ncbi:MAG: polysaccharide deacetylase family protein [Actinomycetota bacterium]|nr:polysaccharide deacetylase family protein [Actinomycetota bacterium]
MVALGYHDVVREQSRETVGFSGPMAARYKLHPDRFEAHLDAIARVGRRVGVVEPDGPLPEVALTFDDGGSSALSAAAAVERRGWRAHFFVTTGRIGTAGFLSEDGIRELVRRGHVVGSHTHTHPTYIGQLPRAAIDTEWRRSRAVLTDVLGEPPPLASVPGGFLSRAVIESAAAAEYRVLMTSEPVARIRRRGGVLLLGRFTIRASTPAERAAAYVRGAWRPRAQIWVSWNVKKVAKRSSPATYEAGRRLANRIDH